MHHVTVSRVIAVSSAASVHRITTMKVAAAGSAHVMMT
jgi:hypothetical protein